MFDVIKEKRNVVYIQYEGGFWFVEEKDESGRVIFWKDCGNNWGKYIYDENGELIFQETSFGN
jgi:hypothetical protein